MKTKWIECECLSPEHAIRFSTFDKMDDPEFLCIEVRPNLYRPWYKRVLIGIKYILGLEDKASYYDITMLGSQRVEALIEYLTDELAKYKANAEKTNLKCTTQS